MRQAAIDIGTVTTRLLIADVDGGVVREVLRDVRITQLGEGLADTGRLSAAGLGAVSAALAEYADLIERHQVARVRCVATSASRDASNAADLFACAAAVGITPEIIPGSEEALLSFAGATYRRCGSGLLVMDPGGGSTEYVLGEAAGGAVDGGDGGDGTDGTRVAFARSLDIGSRRLTDMFVKSDPPTPGELARVSAYVEAALSEIVPQLAGSVRELIAVAGTATSMVTMKYGLTEYDPARVQGQVITRADMELLVEALAARTLAQRQRIPGLDPKRAGVITAGALIILTTLELLDLPSFTASDTDLLYGIVLRTH
jgi:exopolyphosphatase/guanosine-5'-triphosphate,3'-diphosphate pyrophosphatase